MAQRYARVDVDFFHKRTAAKINDALGPLGQLVFLALILRAKDGVVPGTFVYRSDAVAWEKLGLDPDAIPFTLDEFFAVTGKVRMTSRRRVGDINNVRLTRYEAWQKDSRRYEQAVKKARSRGQSTGDTEVTRQGTRRGHHGGPSSRSTSTPKPPEERLNGKTPHRHDCQTCGARQPSKSALEDHIRIFHTELSEPEPVTVPPADLHDHPDDIPLD